MRRSKLSVLWALLFALTLIAAACAEEGTTDGDGEAGGAQETCDNDEFGCVEISEGDPLKLGTLLVISGENASLGLDSQHGVEIAVDMAGGEVLGHEIEFVHQDDQCSAEGGQSGARALSTDPQIVAVVGTSCSSAALGVADQILSDEGIVLISPSNTSPALTDPEQHQPFYLRTAHNDKIQGAAMAQFVATELEGKTAATIHDGSPYAEGLANAFAETFQSEYQGEITTQEAIGVGDRQFEAVLTDIATQSPDFLFYPIFVAEGGLITAQARGVEGLSETDLGGADGMLTPDWIKAAGAENAEGVYLSGPDLEFAGDFYEEEFIPAYEEKFGEPQSVFHAHAFDATNLILQAIEEVAIQEGGTTYIPRTALKDELFATTDYEGIVGLLTCDENGDCNPGATMSVSQVKNGEFEVVWRQAEAEE